jgi:hypothetical protein
MMKPRVLFSLALLVLFAACETTGNPREGGLFGWSETKARQRQAERRAEVGAAETALAREQRRSAELSARDQAAAQRLVVATAKAADERERAAAAVRLHEASVRAKASLLENESPTAATASRARRLHAALDALLANRALSPADRARHLREIEAEIDEARASLNR